MNLVNLKQIIRHLVRRKYYTGITVLGLGIGLGCVILMATYLIHEFSFDKYHSKATDIYRVIDGKDCDTYYAMGEAFKNEIPEIKNICRLYDIDDIKVKNDLQYIEEDKIIFADPSLLEILDLEIIHGSGNNSLQAPDELLISERVAGKYFTNSNPVGQFMSLAVGQRIIDLKVSGVYHNFPSYSSLQTDFICNIENAFSFLWDIKYTIGMADENPEKDYRQVWERNEFATLLQLHPNTSSITVQEKCTQICEQYREAIPIEGIRLQALSKMYLHSNDLENTDMFLTNQLVSLKIFMGIGILILLVALINFILISNADNNLSITEIACRKVNGASRKQILINALFKSVFIAFISLIPAILFVRIMIPIFNNFFQKHLSFNLFLELPYISSLILVTLLTGLCGGFYLGFYVARINPISLFQKSIINSPKSNRLKGSLVIVQFVVFILLSCSFLFMFKQYKYSLNKDLGLNSENIIAVNINKDEMKEKVEYLKTEILSNPNVIDCRPTSFTVPPSDNYLDFQFKNQETITPETIEALIFGEGVIEMLQIPIIEGRSYNSSDEGFGKKFVINEAAAKKFNVKAGEKLDAFNIIGIVKNFHFHSLHRPVEPVFIALQTKNFSYLLIKTNGKNNEVIDFTRQVCQSISHNYNMEYELLDDRIARFYIKEEKQMGTIGFFSVIALALSFMGLLSFVTLNLVKRTKEIGIRKINGATVQALTKMISIQYIKWIMVAFTIACPVAWYAIHKWLENFAYRTSISIWIFILTGAIAILITLITVSWQAYRAANRNPVEALRYE